MNGIQTDFVLRVKNSTYNHNYILPGSHPSIRKISMTEKVQNTIINQTRSEFKSKTIFIELRLSSKTNDEDSIYKPSDIYNVKSKARSEALGSITPTQTLVVQLHRREN